MRIIPVIDIKDGIAVHAVAGQRDQYKPVNTCLTTSSDPVDVAAAFQKQLGLNDLYLADLDAILGGEENWHAFEGIIALGVDLMVDAGVKDRADFDRVAQSGAASVIVGLESVAGPDVLREILGTPDSHRLVFSLDMKNGAPLANLDAWPEPTAEGIADTALGIGVERFIVLDLARVGTGQGTGTDVLCRQLLNRNASLELITGGGIRTIDDLRRERELGASAVLVASALHDGRIDRSALEQFNNSERFE